MYVRMYMRLMEWKLLTIFNINILHLITFAKRELLYCIVFGWYSASYSWSHSLPASFPMYVVKHLFFHYKRKLMRTIVLHFNNYSFAFSIIFSSLKPIKLVVAGAAAHSIYSSIEHSFLCVVKRKVFRFKIMENFPIEFYYFIPLFLSTSIVHRLHLYLYFHYHKLHCILDSITKCYSFSLLLCVLCLFCCLILKPQYAHLLLNHDYFPIG